MSGEEGSERSGRPEERGPSAEQADDRARPEAMSGEEGSERSGRPEERVAAAKHANNEREGA